MEIQTIVIVVAVVLVVFGVVFGVIANNARKKREHANNLERAVERARAEQRIQNRYVPSDLPALSSTPRPRVNKNVTPAKKAVTKPVRRDSDHDTFAYGYLDPNPVIYDGLVRGDSDEDTNRGYSSNYVAPEPVVTDNYTSYSDSGYSGGSSSSSSYDSGSSSSSYDSGSSSSSSDSGGGGSSD